MLSIIQKRQLKRDNKLIIMLLWLVPHNSKQKPLNKPLNNGLIAKAKLNLPGKASILHPNEYKP
jgi:hypothetical protein